VLTNLISLVRFAVHQQDELVPFPDQVIERFEVWLHEQRVAGREFSEEQLSWLEKIRDHVAASLGIRIEDFALTPFVHLGGVGKAVELFGAELTKLLDELARDLVA
jgi:type I restriction enzyme R subunit